MNTLTIYTSLSLNEAQEKLRSYSDWLEDYLQELYDSTDDSELLSAIDHYTEELPLIEGHPIHEELCFDDFDTREDFRRSFEQIFESCRSCFVLYNIADYHLNPLQVSVVLGLLAKLPEGLVDAHGEEFIYSLESYREHLESSYKSINEALDIAPDGRPTQEKKLTVLAVDNPIDYKILQIQQLMAEPSVIDFNEIRTLIPEISNSLELILAGEKNSAKLLRTTELNAKDFGDAIERVYLIIKSKVQ